MRACTADRRTSPTRDTVHFPVTGVALPNRSSTTALSTENLLTTSRSLDGRMISRVGAAATIDAVRRITIAPVVAVIVTIPALVSRQ